MGTSCKGRCIIHPLMGQLKRTPTMYLEGKVYCRTCEYTAFYDGTWCHCCSMRLKRKASSNKATMAILEVKRL